MIDGEAETVMTLKDARRWIQEHYGYGPALTTLYRWCLRGIDGVKLEYIKVGGGLRTSKEALRRFFHREQREEPLSTHSKSLSRGSREAAILAAERELAEAGL